MEQPAGDGGHSPRVWHLDASGQVTALGGSGGDIKAVVHHIGACQADGRGTTEDQEPMSIGSAALDDLFSKGKNSLQELTGTCNSMQLFNPMFFLSVSRCQTK